MLKITDLTCESLTNPIGLYTNKPRLSWKIETDMPDAMQEKYRIEVADACGRVVWDSGEVRSERSVFVGYDGPGLEYATRYFWRVKLTVSGSESGWSERAFFETALHEWTAGFICADDMPESSEVKLFRRFIDVRPGVCPGMRSDVRPGVKSARVYVTALGLYEMEINGKPVTDTCFNPGWSAYDSRVLYQTYDVTALLAEKSCEVRAYLAPGWYKGNMGFQNSRNLYGGKMAFSAQITIIYEDGTVETICTDDKWEYADSPVTYAEIYHGETYDARLENPSKWKPAEIYNASKCRVEPFDGVPVRRHEAFKPAELITTPKGERVLDFGQNMAGRVRFAVDGSAGDTVKLRFAEVLGSDGNFYTDNLRSARCTDTYICKDGGRQAYEPRFTFHGFRYMCVDECPGELKPEDFEAVAIYSDMKKTGEFECSDELINKLQSNITWGLKSNFLDIPTDCPQRDERLGWTGDAQIFIHAAAYLYDVMPFFRKWLHDLALEQRPDGGVPYVIPDAIRKVSEQKSDNHGHSSCAWGDAAVIIPYALFDAFGDKRMLEEQYESMKSWVSYIRSVANNNLWNTGFHYADWVALDAKEGDYKGATPDDLCATAYYAYSAGLLARAARILGKTEDAQEFEKLREDIAKAYAGEFITANGRLAAPTQTAHIISLMFDLVPEKHIPRVTEDLVKLIDANGGHLVTGFIGTPYFCHALSRHGRLDEAYKLLQREDYPSWLYQVKMGATTIWEHLDGIKPDGSMWSADMNSFNHYAYGAVGDWLYKAAAGINPLEPGYKKILIAPQPGGTLAWAEGKLQTPYGEVVSRWEKTEDGIEFTVAIPPNTTAEIRLPDNTAHHVGSGMHSYTTDFRT